MSSTAALPIEQLIYEKIVVLLPEVVPGVSLVVWDTMLDPVGSHSWGNLTHSWNHEENTDLVFRMDQADFVKALLNCCDIKFGNYLVWCSSQAV